MQPHIVGWIERSGIHQTLLQTPIDLTTSHTSIGLRANIRAPFRAKNLESQHPCGAPAEMHLQKN
jgi:hypothetical protein